ncbi:carbohydrate porin [Roseateles koreensis]|uniref:carbohydrate porin n=1 Tax=Roseateles koreensis TaxID=2987526 RepID=UPI00235A0701|nr:carbohydrate porin [Roseateles koreensis]
MPASFRVTPTLAGLLMSCALCAPAGAAEAATEAAAAAPQPWVATGQFTYIGQSKEHFTSPYVGRNSLGAEHEASYSISATAYLGLRVPVLGEVYLNPEVIQGRPLSGLVGLGAFSNGEMQKVAGTSPKLYMPRLFLRRDWALGDEQVAQAAGQNQLAGKVATDRVRLTVGKFAITDIFDANGYSHDSRTQFLNWASLAQGSYDFAADAQGYTLGAALEWMQGDWALRVGRFMVPLESNGERLNGALANFHGDQFELEHSHHWAGLPGTARLLLWRNRENMGAYRDALQVAGVGEPQVSAVRRPQTKSGWGLHLEQALTADLGGFVRWSEGDGRTESYSFEEVDGSRQIGLSLKGLRWGREADTVGLLYIANTLSSAHRDYLAGGGYGFFIGDGKLNYRDETIVEAYYSWSLSEACKLSLDLQHIRNPAYNADRGPVTLAALRFHAEF